MKKRKVNIWVIALISLVVLLVVLFAIFGKGNDTILVIADKPELRNITETVIADGTVQPEVEVKVSSLVTGEILDIRFKEGDSVKKGDLMVIINPELLESGKDRARAALNNAKANKASTEARLEQAKSRRLQLELNYNRNKKLAEQKVLSEAEFDAIRVEFEVAKAEVKAAEKAVEAAQFQIESVAASLKEAEQSLGLTRIYAPMTGVISKLNVEKGERVVGTAQMAGTELLRVADMSSIELKVNVSESDIIRVSVGDSAKIEVAAFDKKAFTGIIREISTSSNSGGLGASVGSDQITNFEVKISILKESYEDLLPKLGKGRVSPFFPGMSGMAEIKTETVFNTVSVPIEAITSRKNEMKDMQSNAAPKTVVYVIDGSVVKEKEIKTGIQDTRYIAITEGLDTTKQIAVGPPNTISRLLKDGTKIKISNKDEIFKRQINKK